MEAKEPAEPIEWAEVQKYKEKKSSYIPQPKLIMKTWVTTSKKRQRSKISAVGPICQCRIYRRRK